MVSPIHCGPKKGGLTVVKNEKEQLIPQRTITGWRMCIDYRKLNKATRKDYFPLPFIDEMLEGWQSIHIFVTLMDTRDSSKYLFIRMINIRPRLLARMEVLHIGGCLLGCARSPWAGWPSPFRSPIGLNFLQREVCVNPNLCFTKTADQFCL